MFQFKVKNAHVVAMEYAVGGLIVLGVKTKYSDEEIISTINYLESKKRKSTKSFKLNLLESQARIIWEAISICLEAEAIKHPEQLPTFIEAFEMLAEKLDGQTIMRKNPFELIKGGKR